MRAIVVIYKNDKSGKPTLTIGELIEKTGIPESTFHRTIKRALEEGGLVKYNVKKKERIVEVCLTDLGRKLGQRLEDVIVELRMS